MRVNPLIRVRVSCDRGVSQLKEDAMSAENKMEAGMDKVKGRVKEAAGKLTDNERLEAEGKVDQAKGDVKSAAEKAKDAVKDAMKD